MIQTATYSSTAEMMAAYADRRRRLMSAMPTRLAPVPAEPVAPQKAVTPIVKPSKPAPMPSWMRGDVEFIAHIDAWKMHLQEQSSPVRYVKRRASELGFTYADIIGPYRGRRVVAARMLLMWEVKNQFPEMSFPRLGRMFGGRDHTTALHAVRRIREQRGQG